MPDDLSTTTAPPPAGHNQGPLLDADTFMEEVGRRYGHLAARAVDLVVGIERFRDKYIVDGRVVIPDEDAQRVAIDFLAKQIKPHLGAIETSRKDAKGVILDVGRRVDAYFTVTLGKALADGEALVRGAVQAFALKQAEEDARRRREEAERLAAEAARLAERAQEQRSDAVMGAALDLEQRAIDTAAGAQGARAGMSAAKVTGDMGGAAHLQGTWKHRITDPKKVPRQFCAPSDTLIVAEMRANIVGGECRAVIKGVEFFFERSVRIR